MNIKTPNRDIVHDTILIPLSLFERARRCTRAGVSRGTFTFPSLLFHKRGVVFSDGQLLLASCPILLSVPVFKYVTVFSVVTHYIFCDLG